MSLIYITGPSGSGKSTVRNALSERGYEAYDTDEDGICEWHDIATGEVVTYPAAVTRPADWFKKHNFLMSAERVKHLNELGKKGTLFLCGVPGNDVDFVEYFDKILCLAIDKETMQSRVASRDTNNFGKSPDELSLMLYWHDKIIERYVNLGATMIDATRPLNEVIDTILGNV